MTNRYVEHPLDTDVSNPYSYRHTWAEVSLDAIAYNMQWFKHYAPASCKVMAVVKADGYGHGAVEIARTAIHAGADYLGVAFLDEALQLRSAGVKQPILLLGYTPPHAIQAAIKAHVTITVFSAVHLDDVMAGCERLGMHATVHIKVDTGMTRLGVTSATEALSLYRSIQSSPLVHLEGIFTHFANADHEDSSYTEQQYETFIRILKELDEQQVHIPLKHCCNSAAAIRFPNMHMDMVRIGIGLYGLCEPRDLNEFHGLNTFRPAMSLKTKISALRRVAANQSIGYGCTFRTNAESWIATIPLGYADGYSRLLSNRGTVLIHGYRAPVVGRVCMDQTMIDVSAIPEAAIGDEVLLFGQIGQCLLPVNEISSLTDTINYEVVCSIANRVPRIYIEGGHIARIRNHFI
jgi:alanine racemase